MVFFAFSDSFEYNGMYFILFPRMKNLRKIYSIILWIVLAFLVWNCAQAKDYEYTNLDIQADVKVDGTIDVTETFTTYFFKKKHGIIRFIPLNYTVEGTDFHIELDYIRVDWNKFTTHTEDGGMNIKIWDPHIEIKWEKTYPISYSVYWLIRNFAWMWYHELYWNLIWYDSVADINKVKAEIRLPKVYTWFSDEDFLLTTDWKNTSIKEFNWTIDRSAWDKITITYNKKLNAGEWITLAIKFPNDYFTFDDERQAWLIKDNNKTTNYKNINSTTKWFIYGMGILIFFLWIMYISKNYLNKNIKPVKISNNFNNNYPVIVQYTPPKWMNSAEAWLLFNCRVDPVDMTSLFYQWAKDNLIKINYNIDNIDPKKIKSVTFTKIKDIPESYPYYEKELFSNLFWDKKSKYINENTDLSKTVSLEWLEDFWLHKHRFFRKKKLSFWRIILSIIFFCLLILWFYYFKRLSVLFWMFSLPLFCGIAYKQNNKIKFTDEWEKLAAHIIWYAKFIKECDEKQLKTFIKEDPLFIDNTLPYAVAFGMETEFMKKVTPLLKDIEQTWLKQNYTQSYPIKDLTCFMKDILSKIHPNRNNVLKPKSYSLYPWWNYNKSNIKTRKWKLKYNINLKYNILKWFKIWSIFSWWWKSFKKWWWGGWWGSKSW